MELDLSDAAQMQRVQREIITAVLPFRSSTDPSLVLFALIRCARVMLRLCPQADQKMLLKQITAYLEGKITAPGVASDFLSIQ